MRALTLWQPWAAAIFCTGRGVENRTWRTDYRGPLLIHAAKRKPTKRELVRFADLIMDHLFPDDLSHGAALVVKALREGGHRGGIIGRVDVVDCVDESSSPWFTGPHAMVLINPSPLPFKPMDGSSGFFEVTL